MNKPSITDFLSGYFHEDWAAEAETDADVIAIYQRAQNSAIHIAELADECDAVAALRETEISDGWLLKVYGCYYAPSVDGFSGSEWLHRVANLLRATADNDSRKV